MRTCSRSVTLTGCGLVLLADLPPVSDEFSAMLYTMHDRFFDQKVMRYQILRFW
jgi:hypothetical protein